MNIQSLTPSDILTIVLKRKWWILVSLVVCMALAYVGWDYFPKSFKSTVIVTIDSPRVAKDYVKGLSPEGRPYDDPSTVVMHQVSTGLAKTTVLMPVLESLKPYPAKEGVSREVLQKRLRRTIAITKPKDGIGIAISYVHSDPHMAQAVTELLVSKLQEESVKQRGGIVENTTEFLTAELEGLKADLAGRILVDITVPLQPPAVRRVHLPKGQAAALEAQAMLGPDVKVVAALHHVSSAHLATDHAIECDVLACSDDAAALETTLGLIRDLGMRGFHAGPLQNAVALESLTPVLLHLTKHYKGDGVGIRLTGLDNKH